MQAPPALLRSPIAALACALMLAAATHASTLPDDYLAATRHEPNFAAAQMQSQNMRVDARIAGTAYLPRADVSLSQDAYDNATRRTLRLVQPLFSADRWLNLQESTPRDAIAEHLEAMARYHLATRVFNAVRDHTSAREKLRLYQSNLSALQAQHESAKLAQQLGQGTVTDVLDTQVRLAHARAQIERTRAELETTRRQYANVTGRPPAPDAYPLQPRALPALQLPALEEHITKVLQAHPGMQAERRATELSAISARRARAQFLPSVNATWQRSQSASNSPNTINGLVLSLDVPIQYSTQYAFQTADNNLIAQQQKERATEADITLETQRIHALALAAQQEVDISHQAIEAAELGLAANEQSFEGGVRTKLDVLNALQALLTAREAHLSAQLVLAESLLGLQLLAGSDIATTLQQIQQLFFAPAPCHEADPQGSARRPACR